MVILDVSIGLVFFFLLFSLVGSATAELVELVLKARARTLEEGIRSLLFDKEGTGMARAFYEHPLIKSLRREPEELPWLFRVLRKWGRRGLDKSPALKDSTRALSRYELPAYIPKELFVAALMDTLARPPEPGKPPRPAVVEQLGLGRVAQALETLPEPNLQRSLVALLPSRTQARAGTDASLLTDELSEFRARLERWFDSSMDRVSGWYKQRTQFVLFLIGLLAALVMNADSIRIAQALARDRALRESVVAVAQEQVKSNPLPAPQPPAQSDDEAIQAYAAALQQQLNTVSARIRDVEGLGLPLGWEAAEFQTTGDTPRAWYQWVILVVLKLLGLLSTAVAVSIGAPFWFDLLNKFMVVRSTVKPQEKSGEEHSKDA